MQGLLCKYKNSIQSILQEVYVNGEWEEKYSAPRLAVTEMVYYSSFVTY